MVGDPIGISSFIMQMPALVKVTDTNNRSRWININEISSIAEMTDSALLAQAPGSYFIEVYMTSGPIFKLTGTSAQKLLDVLKGYELIPNPEMTGQTNVGGVGSNDGGYR